VARTPRKTAGAGAASAPRREPVVADGDWETF